jgi:hypothetical protein
MKISERKERYIRIAIVELTALLVICFTGWQIACKFKQEKTHHYPAKRMNHKLMPQWWKVQ